MLTGEITLLQFFLFLGGFRSFLYGMQLMGDGLQAAAGSKLQRILGGALTKRTIYGVAFRCRRHKHFTVFERNNGHDRGACQRRVS